MSSVALRGIGVSPGYAAGPARELAAPPALPDPVAVADVDAEVTRAAGALAEVAADLDRRAAASCDTTAADILGAQAMMVGDPLLAAAVTDGVRAGQDAPHAIDAAFAAHRAPFVAAGGYLAERAADLDDLRDRAVARCLGLPMPGVPASEQPFVLLARDLAPADTAGLDPAQVLALVTEDGGPASHTAILARALGLPAVVSCTGATAVADGTLVVVDGQAGMVTAGVNPAEVAAAHARQEQERTRLSGSQGPGRTADGHPVPLLANIGSAKDLVGAPEDVEGVGLFRSELLYLDQTVMPTPADQVAAYARVFDALPGRRLVVRTLDAGADKPVAVPGAGARTESGPGYPRTASVATPPRRAARSARCTLSSLRSPNMSVFPTAAHLVSWAKFAPQARQSAGKSKQATTGKGNPWLAGALGEIVATASRTNTFLTERYRRLVKHRGKKRATNPASTHSASKRDLVHQLERLTGQTVTLTPPPEPVAA